MSRLLSPSHVPTHHTHPLFALVYCVSLASFCLFGCLSVCLSACSSVCLSACLSVSLSVCLSICLSVCLSAFSRLSVYSSVCLFSLSVFFFLRVLFMNAVFTWLLEFSRFFFRLADLFLRACEDRSANYWTGA